MSREILKKLRLPVVAAPMFLVSGPKLTIACCNSGIVGTFPALNPRNEELLSSWITEIKQQMKQDSIFGINLIVHKSNKRLQANLDQIIKHKVPLVITSLGAAKEVVDAVHSYGGHVYHDVTNITHARKAISAGVDGLIAVCAGAGGHAGIVSPFALIPQLRREFDGVIGCAGAISTGGGIKAALALGADFAYMGTRFISTTESLADKEYKSMLTNAKTGPSPSFLPIVYTDKVSGVYANFLRESLQRVGLNLDKDYGKQEEDFNNLSTFCLYR